MKPRWENKNSLGNRKQMKRTLFPFLDGRFGTGSHVNYGYDKTSQLTAENYFRPATPNPLQFLSRTNTFDDSGNRLNLTENRGGIVKTIGGAFDEANGLEAETVRFDDVLNQQWQTVFERDLRGNTTKKTVPAGAGREKEEFNYEYNRRNNLTKVTRTKLGEQKEIGFQYNADGLRVEKSFVGGIGVSPVVKKYILDGVHAILERDGEDETKVRYIPGICTIHNPTSENPIPRYDLHDALGSVIAQVSLDEDEPPVVWAAQYGAYGKTLAQNSKTPSPYRWVGAHGYYADEDVGMYLMGYRWYDSFTGRFISRDPIGFKAGDMNLYRPMGNNPVNEVDPEGLAVPVVIVVVAVIGGGVLIGIMGEGVSSWLSVSQGGAASTWEDYLASGIGGAVGVTPLSPLGGVASSLWRQGLKMLTGKQSGFSWEELLTESAIGALPIPIAKQLKLNRLLPGITAGRNSYVAITKSVMTKSTGNVKNVAEKTVAKAFAGSAAESSGEELAAKILDEIVRQAKTEGDSGNAMSNSGTQTK
jgi:RHS repeat-associated protein